MRVALLTSYPPHAIRELVSGTGSLMHPASWVANLPLALERYTDLEVHVVTDSNQIGCDINVQRGRIWVHVVSVPPRVALLTGFQIHIRRLARTLHTLAPDIVHVQGTDYYAIAAMRANIAPVVITVHGVRAQEAKVYAGGFKSSIHWMFLKHFEKEALRSARYGVVINPYVLQVLDLSGMKQYRTIENCVDEVFFEIGHCSPVERIVFVGALDQRKRFIDVVSVALLLRRRGYSIPVHVVSASDPFSSAPYAKRVQAFVREHNLDSLVHWHGRQSPSGIQELLESGAVLILPSSQETAPVVISEAMACGRPVVATQVGGVPYMVKEGETGFLVNVGDVEAMTDRIEELLKNPVRAQEMGRKAQEEALHRFHPEVVAHAHKQFYEEIKSIDGYQESHEGGNHTL